MDPLTLSRSHAQQAGLRWVTDAEPGLCRQPRGKGMVYRTAQGEKVRDKAVLERIRRLVIPPAWRDVWICRWDHGHLQATGRDAQGRKQYRYHAAWQAVRGETKFAHLQEFGRVLPRLRERVRRQLAGPAVLTRERVLATLVRLLDTTWVRIGNAQYRRRHGSYGLSTLRNRHLNLQGSEVQLSFIGKSGVRHRVQLDDPRVARVVRRCRDLPGQELFQYLDEENIVHPLGSSDVNAWLADVCGTCVTAKDFRTWHGSVQALDLILCACAASEASTLPDVITAVARRLGNTPAVCRKAYIHPEVLALAPALANTDVCDDLLRQPWVQSPPSVRGLNLAERRLLALLRGAEPARSLPKKAGL